jgi:hypothetical protein
MTSKWRNRKVRSFRISEELEEMIKNECQRRNLDFSTFVRYAALALCRRQMGAYSH